MYVSIISEFFFSLFLCLCLYIKRRRAVYASISRILMMLASYHFDKTGVTVKAVYKKSHIH